MHLLLDCPISTNVYFNRLPIRARLVCSRSVILTSKDFEVQYHIFKDHEDAVHHRNQFLILDSKVRRQGVLFLETESVGSPILQGDDQYYLPIDSCLSVDRDTCPTRVYVVLTVSTSSEILNSNIGACTFISDESSFHVGPLSTVPRHFSDYFMLLPFWYAKKFPQNLQVGEACSFVDTNAKCTNHKVSLHIESLFLLNQWPDSIDSNSSQGLSMINMPEIKTDASILLEISSNLGHSEQVFFGNTQYKPLNCYSNIKHILADDKELQITLTLFEQELSLFEIVLSIDDNLFVLYSDYLRKDTQYIFWENEPCFFSFLSPYGKKNTCSLRLPFDLLMQNGSKYEILITRNKIPIFEDRILIQSLNAMVNDLVNMRHPSDPKRCKDISSTQFSSLYIPQSQSILFCFHNMNITEGSPRVFSNIIRGIIPTNFHIRSFQAGDILEDLKSQGIEIKTCAEFQISKICDKNIDKAIEYICSDLLATRPALVVINSIDSFLYAYVAIRLHIPVVWVIHESILPLSAYPEHDLRVKYLFIDTLKRSNMVIFVSEETQKIFANYVTKSTVIRNGIDIDLFSSRVNQFTKSEARSKIDSDISNDEYVFISVGTTVFRKGQDRTVLELKKLSEMRPDIPWRFFIVGGRKIPYYYELLSLITKYGLDSRITIIDETCDVEKYYAAADFFICNSREESSPLVILEAMIAKIPVISTDVFGLKELLKHEYNSLIFDPSEQGSLSGELIRLIEDKKLLLSITENAYYEVCNRYSLDIMCKAYQKIFDELKIS